MNSHTKTLPDGRVVDILLLQKKVKTNPVLIFSLNAIHGASRTKKTGFSKKRYQNVDFLVPGIVDAEGFLLDGRHRYLHRLDYGYEYMPVRCATTAQINKCIIK